MATLRIFGISSLIAVALFAANGCFGVSAINTGLGITSCSAIPGIVDSGRPQVSPDGTKIVVHSKMALNGVATGVATFSSNIWIMSSTGTSATALTRNSAANLESLNPRFSADGAKIIFQSKMPLSANGTSWDGTALPVYNIWSMNIDGTSLTPLTSNTLAGLDSVTPAYAPSNLKVVFSSKMDTAGAFDTFSAYSSNIFEMNPDGTALTALTTNTLPYLDSWTPVYSPDSVTIVFSSYTSTGGAMDTQNTFSSNIVTIPSGGGALTFWTANTSPWLDSIQPVFLPDATGSVIAYASRADTGGVANTYGTNSYNIWTAAAGPVLTALTTNTTAYLDSIAPVYSPDQLTVVFSSLSDITGVVNGTRSNSYNLMSVPAATGPITTLTSNTAVRMDSTYPVYDPAGTFLFYQSLMHSSGVANAGSSGSTNIWSMTPAGASVTPLTNASTSCINL